ncbi:kinesin motor domain-containing protein, partial [Pavlovales sp. CCMP2436]
LNAVDLAGCEKKKHTSKKDAIGETLVEANQINNSLSALGIVIRALVNAKPHVPYRDSKLTRLLKESLGGNAKTTLLVVCSPARKHLLETLSTLRFAARAKKVPPPP